MPNIILKKLKSINMISFFKTSYKYFIWINVYFSVRWNN